jgi:hypothetical protein
MLSYHTLLLFRYANRDLDKPILAHFAPLKTKVARWKVHFLLRICEKIHVQHSSEQMAYYSRYAIGKKGAALGVL